MPKNQTGTTLENFKNEQLSIEQVVAQLKKNYDLVLQDGAVIRISQNDTWGFANSEGKVLIKPKYFFLESFKNGFARVRETKSMLWGLVSIKGKVVVEPEYEEILGLDKTWPCLVAKDCSGKYGCIDYKGRIVVPFVYDAVDYKSSELWFKKGNDWLNITAY